MSKKCRSPLTKLGLVTNQAAGAAWIGAVDGASHCLNCRGIDYKKMEIHALGRTLRLVEEGDGPIKEILA